MKKALLLILPLLSTGVFAQEYARTTRITDPVAAGAVRTARFTHYLTAINTIERGATAHYTAGQSVTLQPGFTAQAGSVFQATISPVDSRNVAETGETLTVSLFPNPLKTAATLTYNLPEATRVTHTLTDVQGRPIRQISGPVAELAGRHNQTIDAAGLPIGTYLYKIRTNRESRVIRFIKE